MLPPSPAKPNAGLVFDRFLRIWQSDVALVKERLEPLRQFVEDYEKCQGSFEPRLKETHARLRALVGGPERGERTLITRGRLASGLGSSHPLENGFCFDYTLGVPCLPGSAIKGLCRQVADPDSVRTLLGSGDEEEGDHSGQAPTVGDVVFFPAYPENWPKLEVDVINCHQQEYYGGEPVVLRAEAIERRPSTLPSAGSRRVGPLEVEDPVPVFFLSVAKDTRFVFRCASRSDTRAHVTQALELIADGLAGIGIGAKTALGYGVMAVP